MVGIVGSQTLEAVILFAYKATEGLGINRFFSNLHKRDKDCQFALVPSACNSVKKPKKTLLRCAHNGNRIFEIGFFVGESANVSLNDLIGIVVLVDTKLIFVTGWPLPLYLIDTTKSYFYVHVFCRIRKKTFVSNSKFFVCAPAKRECNAIDSACFPSKNHEKSAIFASDSHTWRINSTKNWSLSEWCSPARKTRKRHCFDFYRDRFSMSIVNSIAKFTQGVCCFSSYLRGFSARLASNSTKFSHSNMRPITYYIFGIVSLHARSPLSSQGLDAEFHTSSDSFGQENSLTEMKLTMLSLVENVIPTYSFIGFGLEKCRCRQKFSLSTASTCVVYKRALLRRTVRGPLASVRHGGRHRG